MTFPLLLALALTTAGATPPAPLIEGRTPAERTAAFLEWCAATPPSRPTYPKEATAYYLARLLLNRDTAAALHGLDAAVTAVLGPARAKSKANPTEPNPGDPFDKHALLNGYLLCPEKIPAATALKIRDYMAVWRHREYTGYGALNYRLMKDGSGFLAAETWPELIDADGLNAERIKAVTRERLLGYFRSMVRENLDEYNAPVYFACDLMPLRMLAEFARDEVVQRQATLTLDWMLLNLACSWNQGYYTSATARAKYWGSVACSPDAPGPTATVGWFYFGGRRGVDARHTGAYHAFWLAWPGRYRLPDLISEVALDRAEPFVVRESVAVGAREIRKQTYHARSYSLASQWERIARPDDSAYKESKRQLLKWVSDRPASTFSIQQENYLRPYRPKDVTPNAFGYGENPFHQLMQHVGVQIGVYDVPEGFPFWRLYVPFVRSGAIVKRIEREGWYVCHGGSMLFAFRPLKPGAWGKVQENCDVLWFEPRRNGWVLETSELDPWAGGGIDAELARYAEALVQRARIVADVEQSPPRLRYTALSGHTLELTYTPHGTPYTDQHKVDGQVVDYRAFPLLSNPWVDQAVHDDRLTIRRGERSLVYDFERWQVTGDGLPAR